MRSLNFSSRRACLATSARTASDGSQWWNAISGGVCMAWPHINNETTVMRSDYHHAAASALSPIKGLREVSAKAAGPIALSWLYRGVAMDILLNRIRVNLVV